MFLLEAMACGVPVVQPRRGSFPEIIEKTLGGVLVEPDDPDALAEGLLSIWRDRALREEHAHNGYERVRKYYSAAAEASRALEVYATQVKSKK
jgi:glycosyltransferase involved in cell wall biosynthesis